MINIYFSVCLNIFSVLLSILFIFFLCIQNSQRNSKNVNWSFHMVFPSYSFIFLSKNISTAVCLVLSQSRIRDKYINIVICYVCDKTPFHIWWLLGAVTACVNMYVHTFYYLYFPLCRFIELTVLHFALWYIATISMFH